jgi:hypothetical protein
VAPSDHHSAYLAKAVAALTPEGRTRVDELLDGLAEVAEAHEGVARFAMAARAEAHGASVAPGAEPATALSRGELDVLLAGFVTIRDQEPLDDVGDWANALVALLEDEARTRSDSSA